MPIAPAPVDDVSGTVDLARLGIADVTRVYDVTTPAGEPFSFDLLTRGVELRAQRIAIGRIRGTFRLCFVEAGYVETCFSWLHGPASPFV